MKEPRGELALSIVVLVVLGVLLSVAIDAAGFLPLTHALLIGLSVGVLVGVVVTRLLSGARMMW